MNLGTEPSALNLPRVLFAAGALAALAGELQALGVRKPLLVTDQGLVAVGLAAKAIAACGKNVPEIFDNVTENPLFSDVDKGAAWYAQQGCDGVVALGGGSVIDTAKMIALLATNPGSVADYAGVRNAPHGPSAPLIVIPTTAGTGSEASPSAGIHPDAVSPSVGMGSRHLVPKLAILDPNLTRSLPPRLRAATGIDALSHCIEGYLSKKDIPLGKSIALDGIARVARYLSRAVTNRDDAEARGEMMLAAFAGGTAIGMGLGPAHAVAIGNKGLGFLNRSGVKVVSQATMLGDTPHLDKLIGPVKVLLDSYVNGEIHSVHLCYTRFINTMKQESVVEQLLPLSADDFKPEAGKPSWDYIYEPDAHTVIEELLIRYVEALVYQAVAESMASEQSARMVAMKSATDNAGNVINELKLIYNKTRQAAITKELSEIVAGAAAV
jgi:4-hydroxybutyrate dehydrogenase